VLAIIFATRGTMASNREIVDVLHFIGVQQLHRRRIQEVLSIGFRGGPSAGSRQ
jgi:cell division transport system permease protein